MSEMGNHIVMDSIRQTLRCNHCRAEAPLPPQPSPITVFVKAMNAWGEDHTHCAARCLPTPAYVRTAPDGAAIKRDHDGLWWNWQPVAGRRGNELPTYSVMPVPLGDALEVLRALTVKYAESTDWDDKGSVTQARAALTSEGASL